MTREEASEILNRWVEISKSSEDYNKDEGFLYTDIGTITYGDIEEAIKTLEQEPKTGRWIEHKWAEEVDNRLISNFECSCCHTWKRDESSYCPECGRRMVEPQESEEE